MTGPVDAVTAWLAAYGSSGHEQMADEFVQRYHRDVQSEVEAIGSDAVLLRLLDEGARAQWTLFVRSLTTGTPTTEVPEQSVAFILALARRGHDASTMLEVHRVGQRAVWAFLNDVCELIVAATDAPRNDIMLFLLERVSSAADEALADLGLRFEEVRREATESGAARRWQVLDALLRGDEIDVDRATQDLGHPLRGWHTAVVLQAPDDTPEQAATLLSGLARALPGAAVLMHQFDSRQYWAWLSTRARHQPGPVIAAASSVPAGIQVALGGPLADLAGFHDSHLHAMAAHCLAQASTVPRSVVHYDEVELVGLMARQPAIAHILMRRELNALAGTSSGLQRLRETLLAYLQSGGQVGGCAARLGIHKNTVRNRLARAEELLGRGLDERRSHLELALSYYAEGMPVVEDHGEPGSRQQPTSDLTGPGG